MKIIGIKVAVGDYKRANKGGMYSPRYGRMMLDRKTGEVWTDVFYDIGHNTWTEYRNPAIINLGRLIGDNNDTVNMQTVRKYAEASCAKYSDS